MKTVAVALIAVSSLVPRGCGMPSSPQPPPGEHHLPIAFQHWIYPGACSAANVSMWVRYRGTSYDSSQQYIIDYMSFEYWWEVGPDGSFSPWAIQEALWEWSRIDTRDEFYVGESEKRQGIADIKKGIAYGNPTIVITNSGLHSKLVIGGNWQQLTNYQPVIESIHTADPEDYGYRSDQVGYWLSSVGNGDYTSQWIRTIGVAGQRNFAVSELAEFDYWGGTYYGDETPPDGCPECPPLIEAPAPEWLQWATRLFQRPHVSRASLKMSSSTAFPPTTKRSVQPTQGRPVGPEQQKKHAVRRTIFVPKPYATSNADIMENLLAGMNQMDLHNTAGWDDLDSLLASRQITASSIEPVESLSGSGPYWLVTLRAYGQPFAQALVSRTGWLLSIMRAQPGLTVPEPHSMRWAGAVAASLGYASPRLRRVHMANNLTRTSGSADYYPFFEIATPGREILYLTQEGSVFKLDPQGTGIAFWKDGMRRLTRIR